MSTKTIVKEELISKGAEAHLYYGHWFDKKAIFKWRIPKKYRLGELDNRIRSHRTVNEGRALINVKEEGINVPSIYEIDTKQSLIVMEFIEGNKLKDLLVQLADSKKKTYFIKVGKHIARLHLNGHIHGDLTTSNIIITPSENVVIIDFGLHEYSDSIEDKSVDLHLLKRVLISSHGTDYNLCFNAFLSGYKSEYIKLGLKDDYDSIIKNIAVIESRGRYIKKTERQ
ncbi:MAG: Kae1-associated serine/threonine protein kinase [Promethearchaeota archaeon]|nr:MAG: Kae1-associated serine/threonine protein kinase [Candidatus Lokiarchaeota archaeon]